MFDRESNIRARCGYTGLRNLGNTCYLNSLFTQLFMNVNFRNFILEADLHDRDDSQRLLHETQALFARLQEGLDSSISTQSCVNYIKPLEGLMIDVAIQMDVDEFFNIIFDRWEMQLSSAAARQQFRSFYGGQLVQQIRSNECEHVSEVFEPFTAIQCDIKGKSSLEQSLEAYIKGERMAGGMLSSPSA